MGSAGRSALLELVAQNASPTLMSAKLRRSRSAIRMRNIALRERMERCEAPAKVDHSISSRIEVRSMGLVGPRPVARQIAAWPPVRWRGLPGVSFPCRWRRAVRPYCGLDADACSCRLSRFQCCIEAS